MIVHVFDIAAALGFGAATVITLILVLTTRRTSSRRAMTLLVAAMTIMTAVSLNHTISWIPDQGAEDLAEDYAQVIFLPLILYAMHGLYQRSETERTERALASVSELDDRLAASLEELSDYRVSVLQSLGATIDARDQYTALHSLHVADYAVAIGAALGMHERLDELEQAGLLHDIGKIAIPDVILLKPAALTAQEYATMQRHAEVSAEIIGGTPALDDLVPGVRHHHERWDGSGYPAGLTGEAIPMEARILAVADAFDAMTSDRPYRTGMPLDEARAELLAQRGRQFDPTIIDTFIPLLDEKIVTLRDYSTTALQEWSS
ncbi:MAG: HD-GYP domain-containing protein [Coriobacteriia bacterium]|nr:HD-GYP domain-containing protein [Coriobacteriia bacterium]